MVHGEYIINYTKLFVNKFGGYFSPAKDYSFFDPMGVPGAVLPRTYHTMNYSLLFPMSVEINADVKIYRTFHFLPNQIYGYPGQYSLQSLIGAGKRWEYDGNGIISPFIDTHITNDSVISWKSQRLSYVTEETKKDLFTVSRTSTIEEASDQYGYNNILNGVLRINVYNYGEWMDAEYTNDGVNNTSMFNFPVSTIENINTDNNSFVFCTNTYYINPEDTTYGKLGDILLPLTGHINADLQEDTTGQFAPYISGGPFYYQPSKIIDTWSRNYIYNSANYSTSGIISGNLFNAYLDDYFVNGIIADNQVDELTTGQEFFELTGSGFRAYAVKILDPSNDNYFYFKLFKPDSSNNNPFTGSLSNISLQDLGDVYIRKNEENNKWQIIPEYNNFNRGDLSKSRN